MLWPDSQDSMSASAPSNGPPKVGASDSSHAYGPYSLATANGFLDKVRKFGMSVTGDNPWSIDANQHGIKLVATRTQDGRVTITVVDKNFYVAYPKIWEKVDPLMPKADAVVGDALTRWDILAQQMQALDLAKGVTLHGADGRVLGLVVGEDWAGETPSSSDPAAQVSFLEKAYDTAHGAFESAQSLGTEEKTKVLKATAAAAKTAKDLAKDVVQAHVDALSTVADKAKAVNQDLQSRSDAVMKKWDDLWDDVKTAGGIFGGAVLGVAVGWWVVVGVGAYLYFKPKKAA